MILHGTEIGSGPPVLLLHGLFGVGRNLGVVQRALASRFRVLALDLRNHGASGHVWGMDYDAMAADVAETLADRGIASVAAIGHSMGGKTAMRLALRRPDLIARLCVVDIAPAAYPPTNAPVVAAMGAVDVTRPLSRAEADEVLARSIGDAALRAFLLQNLIVGAVSGWRIGLAEIAAALADVEGWAPIDCPPYAGPTLFVAGARSDFIRPEHRPPIRALFPAARFATVKDAGHWLHVDNPAGFLGILEAFIP